MRTDLSDEEIDIILERENIGVVSFADESTAYSIPITFGYDKEFIYFQFVSKEDSKKEDFIDTSEIVSFVVFTKKPPKSVIVKGEIDYIEPNENVTRAMIDNADFPVFNFYPDIVDENLTFNYYILRPYTITGKSFENIF